jgi:hypothetical protein
MTRKLPPSASLATPAKGAKLYAPSASNNAEAICAVLAVHAPATGHALEIASGTGQHITAFACALPGLVWQPTEIDPQRRASIDAYVAEANRDNLRPAIVLDATVPGWHREHGGQSLIVLINLLHLISSSAAQIVLAESLAALAPGGSFVIYGPFRRNGLLTSEGDLRFDNELRAADPEIGYKNDKDIASWLSATGAKVESREMPANNLCFVVRKPLAL